MDKKDTRPPKIDLFVGFIALVIIALVLVASAYKMLKAGIKSLFERKGNEGEALKLVAFLLGIGLCVWLIFIQV